MGGVSMGMESSSALIASFGLRRRSILSTMVTSWRMRFVPRRSAAMGFISPTGKAISSRKVDGSLR